MASAQLTGSMTLGRFLSTTSPPSAFTQKAEMEGLIMSAFCWFTLQLAIRHIPVGCRCCTCWLSRLCHNPGTEGFLILNRPEQAATNIPHLDLLNPHIFE